MTYNEQVQHARRGAYFQNQDRVDAWIERYCYAEGWPDKHLRRSRVRRRVVHFVLRGIHGVGANRLTPRVTEPRTITYRGRSFESHAIPHATTAAIIGASEDAVRNACRFFRGTTGHTSEFLDRWLIRPAYSMAGTYWDANAGDQLHLPFKVVQELTTYKRWMVEMRIANSATTVANCRIFNERIDRAGDPGAPAAGSNLKVEAAE